MITVKLKGGMGNQLFQWALGRALRECGARVQYDLSWFDSGPRPFALGAFTIDVTVGKAEASTPIYHEQGLRYQSIPLSPDIVLDGHWQCERYFRPIQTAILRDVKPRYYPIEVNLQAHETARAIVQAKSSCFVHVRRAVHPTADYPEVHGVLSLDYYRAAMKLLPADTRLFVFSDDVDWCLKNFTAPNFMNGLVAYTVTGNDAVTDLFLMSLCDHAIIANSTFSWWGAWLGPDIHDGTVIAPKQWFAPTSNYDATDIVPERWQRI